MGATCWQRRSAIRPTFSAQPYQCPAWQRAEACNVPYQGYRRQLTVRGYCDPRRQVYPFVIGREGRTKKKIEAETGAQLTIPSKQQQQQQQQGSGGGDIVIRGPSRQVVSSAYVRTELAIHSAMSGRWAGGRATCVPMHVVAVRNTPRAFSCHSLHPRRVLIPTRKVL